MLYFILVVISIFWLASTVTLTLNTELKHINQIFFIFTVPGDAVKGKTWGPSTASTHVKQRPTIVPPGERGGQGRWKATSAPSLEKSPRSHVNVPSVGTVPEGEDH